MRSAISKIPRSERTLDYYFCLIMDDIVEMYLMCVPELNRDSFKRLVYQPLSEINISGDDVILYFREAGERKLLKGDATLLACIYCIQSRWTASAGHEILAWSYMMEAQKYIAMAITEDASEPQLAKVLDFARTEAKSKAAMASVAVSVQPWRETKLEALRLIEEKALNGQRWDNAEQAAVEILDDLREFLKAHSVKKPKDFWSSTPEKTVAHWLRQMSNAGNLFRNNNA